LVAQTGIRYRYRHPVSAVCSSLHAVLPIFYFTQYLQYLQYLVRGAAWCCAWCVVRAPHPAPQVEAKKFVYFAPAPPASQIGSPGGWRLLA
jgi:hypothetical protein